MKIDISAFCEIRSEINAIITNSYNISERNINSIKTNASLFINSLNKNRQEDIWRLSEKCLYCLNDFKIEKDAIDFNKKNLTRLIELCWDIEIAILNKGIENIDGVGSKYKSIINKKNIFSIRQLIEFFPSNYLIFEPAFVKDAEIGGLYYISGKITSIKKGYIKSKKMFYTDVALNDGTGILTSRFFGNQFFYKKNFYEGLDITLFGKLEYYNLKIFYSPSYKLEKTEIFGNSIVIEPVYSIPKTISNLRFRKIIAAALNRYLPIFSDFMPSELKKENNFLEYKDCVRFLHNPDNPEFIRRFQNQSVYYNFFLYQLRLQINKLSVRKRNGISFDFELCKSKLNSFINGLNFKLTQSQKYCLNEIVSDMKNSYPMMRLMQGDVGCGKTIIAVILSIAVVENGRQFIIMVPSEILAEQHFKTFSKYLHNYGYKIALLNSSVKKKEKEIILAEIAEGKTQIIIGTHSLLSDSINYFNPGFIVIDEQHKFGVGQRDLLTSNKNNPDVLIMTATPIPRTLGLTVFSDLDISVITEKPSNRLIVETKIIEENALRDLYDFIIENSNQNLQTFFVYPAIEENDKTELKSVEKKFAELSHTFFKDIPSAMIHGKIKQAEREKIMSDFSNNKIKILFSTIVIEVGIDIPNANIIVIEHPERFGLAQLHQLRGRVGRNAVQSYCFLIKGANFPENSEERIHFFANNNDGLKLSEFDLKNRGMGDLIGSRQSGLTFNLIRDIFKYENLMIDIKNKITTMINSGCLEKNIKYPLIKKLIN
ncbi:MAG TPA: ATP-dependent DNA helicase RecG [bacterium]|nr:ATP-dependent DNA helicase RecG [bacterium]HPN29944.1 ATP-dependent DNA helicase RecG [bacterium]